MGALGMVGMLTACEEEPARGKAALPIPPPSSRFPSIPLAETPFPYAE